MRPKKHATTREGDERENLQRAKEYLKLQKCRQALDTEREIEFFTFFNCSRGVWGRMRGEQK